MEKMRSRGGEGHLLPLQNFGVDAVADADAPNATDATDDATGAVC